MALPFPYEDRYPEYTAHGYVSTNEEPLLIRTMIKPFQKGLGICSAGEVTFLALLPKCRESLTLIDHSYRALGVFMIKAMMLQRYGPTKTRNAFLEEKQESGRLRDMVSAVFPDLPSRIQTESPNLYGDFATDIYNLRREWFYADMPGLRRSTDRLDRLRLIHGDLLDTADRAPFDFAYLSNALEHQGRPVMNLRPKPSAKAAIIPQQSYNSPMYPQVTKLSEHLLTKGSHILWVAAQGQHYGQNAEAQKYWKTHQNARGYRTSWQYIFASLEEEKWKSSESANVPGQILGIGETMPQLPLSAYLAPKPSISSSASRASSKQAARTSIA